MDDCTLATSSNRGKDKKKTLLGTLIMETPTLLIMYVGLDNPLACCLEANSYINKSL